MVEETKRVEVGFAGGQVMTARLTERQLEELRGELASTDKLAGEAAGWHEIESEEGTVSVDLRQVVFVKVAGAPHAVGFSGA